MSMVPYASDSMSMHAGTMAGGMSEQSLAAGGGSHSKPAIPLTLTEKSLEQIVREVDPTLLMDEDVSEVPLLDSYSTSHLASYWKGQVYVGSMLPFYGEGGNSV